MWPASSVAFELSVSPMLLKNAQEAVKRFLIVNMSLVKASAFINSSKTFVVEQKEGKLPGFVDQLPVRHAKGLPEFQSASLAPQLLLESS